ncbi:THAP domain-containing protein 4 [Nephila pilipes]|uniref:THAP domain-containing protein 4 n=1 Tax=Nephila pilipes TaxID=299642 RepID=A0A8X6N992_NEPPI|nr:THAP domain-containing protein 4 [Nephila pilipes]
MQVDNSSINSSILLDATCSAYNCSNKIGEVIEGVTFHRFPLSKPDLLAKWLTAMRKDKWVPTKSDVLCSFHFTDDQFVENNGYRFLVPNAVPSKFEVLAPPKTLFPNEWSARLLTIRDIESDNHKGYVVEARIPLVNKDQFTEWLATHEKLAQVSYVLLRNYPTTSKNLSYKAEYVCMYGSTNDHVKSDKPCPARLLVRIRADPKFRFNKPSSDDKTSLFGYPCNVVLYHLHNHSIGSNAVETKIVPSEEVSTVVKQKFNEMFKGGYSVEMALATHQKDLFEEYTDEYDEVLNDAYVCPTIDWLTKFHENFLEEFDWNDTKIVNILKEEIEDINASKGSATMNTIGEDIIVVLSTPLMQRAHSMKSSGEVVFVDNSGYLDRCRCYVYVVMAYSCTEGLPLGLLITTSATEEILTAGFKLLAETLPDKAFGSFGRQGPEVFLTANDDALQHSLKAVYPESAVLLCAYNMSHELWRWLWNPDNGIEESDRCKLFSLAYKIMQTKTVEEFTELSEALIVCR